MMIYYLLRIGSAVSRVAPVRLLYALAILVARGAALPPSAARAAARANIARVLGQPTDSPTVRRAAARAFRCQALNYVDLMRLDHVTRAGYEADVVRGDLSLYTRLVEEGKGVIIVSAHVGNMDYVAQWLALKGYPVHTVMEDLQPPKLFDLVRRQRESAGLHMHPLRDDAIAGLTAILRAGGTVALIADRDIGGGGEPVPFFGAEASLPIGPALLALRTGAPIVAAFGRRLPDNRLYVSVAPPVYLRRTRDLRADLREGQRAIAGILEDGIRVTPEQWIVFEPIWPAGAARTKDEAA